MSISLDKLFGAANPLKAVDLSQYITQEVVFDVKNTNITYKTINRWSSQNLLVSGRTDESKGLTIEKLKKHQGFEYLNDDEAKVLIKNIDQLALVFYEYFKEVFDEKDK
ncbi:MAG: hypothetical protein MI921_17415 [Cytophagales bacterium]|nr:hypothetical protein [Cytophagales bacterium]